MSFRDLRRHTAEIDEQHRESMRTIADDLGELHFGTDPALAGHARFELPYRTYCFRETLL